VKVTPDRWRLLKLQKQVTLGRTLGERPDGRHVLATLGTGQRLPWHPGRVQGTAAARERPRAGRIVGQELGDLLGP